jgi:hypothetical protein
MSPEVVACHYCNQGVKKQHFMNGRALHWVPDYTSPGRCFSHYCELDKDITSRCVGQFADGTLVFEIFRGGILERTEVLLTEARP